MTNETTTRMFQGTPGPWNTSADDSMNLQGGRLIRAQNDGWIADVCSEEEKNVEADANLIAAAPDLLEACIASLILVRVAYTEDSEVGQQLEAAITKALGSPS